MAEPTISVVMSALNAERTIGAAIRSIISQSFTDWELIVIDDGSTDGTGAIIGTFPDPRIRLVRHGARRGLAARLNEAVALAKGPFIARMDADDISYPERFEKQLAFLQGNAGVDLVGCAVMAFKDPFIAVGVTIAAPEHAAICAHPERGFDVAHPTWLGRREFFRRYAYDARALRAQDQDLLLRAHRSARFANLRDVLLGYRLESVTARNTARGRLQYCRSIVRTWGAERAYWRILHGVLTQVARGAVAVPLIALGFGERIVGRRFARASEAQMMAWQAVSAAHASGRSPMEKAAPS